jgi:DNA-binding MarR family transcriptional regulator
VSLVAAPRVPRLDEPVELAALPFLALLSRMGRVVADDLTAGFDAAQVGARPLDAALLTLLSREPARLTQLAARLRTTKQALTFVISRLERDGLVERTPDPGDSRAKRIVLTDRGRRAAGAAMTTMLDLERRWRQAAGDDAYESMRTTMARILAAEIDGNGG